MKVQRRSLGLHQGWRYEGYRHSLAAKGIKTKLCLASSRTSFGTMLPIKKNPLDLEKKYFKDFEIGIESRLEPEVIGESEFLEPDVLVKDKRAIVYAAKKDVPGQNPGVTANYYRYRQEDPKKYDQFRVKVLPSGKKLVFGRKKTKSKHKLGKWEVQSILVPRVEVAQK